MHGTSFQCCLEKSLRRVHIDSVDAIYKATKHCAKFGNHTVESQVFLQEVFHFYLGESKNATIQCLHIEYNSTPCDKNMTILFFVYVMFWMAALVIGLLGNIIVIFAFYRSSVLRGKITNHFLVSLAVSDLLVVIFIIPYKIYFSIHNHYFCAHVAVCYLFFTTDNIFFVASMTNLFAIAIDRFMVVNRPYDYINIVTKRRAHFTIGCIWLYATCWGMVVNFNFKSRRFDAITVTEYTCTRESGVDTIVQYIMVFFLPSLCMLVLYVKILRITFRHAKKIVSNRVQQVNREERRSSISILNHIQISSIFNSYKIEFRATKVILVIYGTFMVCWLPVITIAIANVIKHDAIISSITYIIFGEMLPVINSILNPFIYVLLHRDFKINLKQIFRKLNMNLLRDAKERSTTCLDHAEAETVESCARREENVRRMTLVMRLVTRFPFNIGQTLDG